MGRVQIIGMQALSVAIDLGTSILLFGSLKGSAEIKCGWNSRMAILVEELKGPLYGGRVVVKQTGEGARDASYLLISFCRF